MEQPRGLIKIFNFTNSSSSFEQLVLDYSNDSFLYRRIFSGSCINCSFILLNVGMNNRSSGLASRSITMLTMRIPVVSRTPGKISRLYNPPRQEARNSNHYKLNYVATIVTELFDTPANTSAALPNVVSSFRRFVVSSFRRFGRFVVSSSRRFSNFFPTF